MNLEQICEATVQAGASDLILHEGTPLSLRVKGGIARIDATPISAEVLDTLWQVCGTPAEANDYNAAFVSAQGERFRVNFFRTLGRRGAVLRHIRGDVPSLAQLGAPEAVLRDWLSRKSGMILVTGPTGSGQSTTIASCLEQINEFSARHIVTVEDPVEFVFRENCSIFTQRDVGIDTSSFAEGLRQALRQAPDVIFLGEIRDTASAVTAIHAAETGHLVLATIHGSHTSDALERMSQLLPEAERKTIARIFASQLLGILAQRLLPTVSGDFALALEYFSNVGAVRAFIEEGRTSELHDFLERANSDTALSMLHSVAHLCRSGVISESTALSAVEKPGELSRLLRGISSATSRR